MCAHECIRDIHYVRYESVFACDHSVLSFTHLQRIVLYAFRYVRYETESGFKWDGSGGRSLGPVSQQSWYHGAKQVAEATWAMQSTSRQ